MNRSFAYFSSAHFLNCVGEFAFQVAMAWWLLNLDGSGRLLSIVMAAVFMARLLLMPILGPLGDLYSKSRIILSLGFLRLMALAVLLVSIHAGPGHRHNGFLVLICALIGAGSPLYSGVLFSIVPDILDEAFREQGFARINISIAAGSMLGSLMGGLAVSKSGENSIA
jgi:MFS family permease